MPENRIEHRSREPGEFGHQLREFTVEVAQQEQGGLAQHGEARVVNRAYDIFRLEQRGHHWRKLIRQSLGVRWRLQGKAEREVGLAHSNILLATGAAILSMKVTRACESLRRNSMAIFSFSDFGLPFCCFSCAQVDVWYFWITLSAAKSNSMPW